MFSKQPSLDPNFFSYLNIVSYLFQLIIRKTKSNACRIQKIPNEAWREKRKIIIIKFTPKVCFTKVANGTMITLWIPFLTHESQQNTSTQSSWFINTRKSTDIKRKCEWKECGRRSKRKEKRILNFLLFSMISERL